MPTIIDQLVVELGIDPTKAELGAKRVKDLFKKNKDELDKQAKDSEEIFSSLYAKSISFVAALVGAGSIEQFVASQTRMNTQLGISSKLMGVGVTTLSSWRNMAELAGGSAEGMQGALRNVQTQMTLLTLTGKSDLIPFFNAMHLDWTKAHGDLNELFLMMADWAHQQKPEVAYGLLSQMGFDEGTINLMIKGRGELQKWMDLQKKNIAVTKEDTDAAIRLNSSWVALSQSLSATGRAMVTRATPALASFFDWATKALTPDIADRVHIWQRQAGYDHPLTRAQIEERLGRKLTADELKRLGLANVGSAPPAVTAPTSAPQGSTPSNVNQQAWAAAQASQAEYGIPAEVTYAQWMLESAGGRRMPAGSNNPFGIKAGKNQLGVWAMTNEEQNGVMVRVKQRFRVFKSIAEAFAVHARDLARLPTYANARQHLNDPDAYADALTGVYASDLNYGAKLKSIMHSFHPPTGLITTAPAMASGGATAASAGTMDLSKNETNIGQITVVTKDPMTAGQIARDIAPALKKTNFALQANSGPS